MPTIYVFSYFTSDEESLHLAVSADGRVFAPIDKGRELLRGTTGNRSLRDPFIGTGPDGRFHLLATNGWESTSIIHAVSDDLLTWSEQKELPVMSSVPGTLNSWAPEFFLEPATGAARILWSSVVDPHPVSGKQGALSWNDRHQSIWSCVTEDFEKLSLSQGYFDPGFSVIDASVLVLDGGELLMAYKDEVGEPSLGGEHNRIWLRRISTSGGIEEFGPVTPPPTEGPTMFKRDGDIVMLFDHYLEGRYGAVRSEDGARWEPDNVTAPTGARHGAVLTIDATHPAADELLVRAGLARAFDA
ncbi:hypothetical protein MHM582_3500 [Microbacterium sp. HM58-2]|nr:hypothetical protein MHM582_3500 [Microbacterium sp. HM58-2]